MKKKMKTVLAVVGLLISIGIFGGCMEYGSGASTGYVYAVDDGIIWDKVWFKPSMESTESDCYLVSEDSSIKEDLKNLKSGQQIKIEYKRHFVTLSACPEGTGTEDEIIKFEVVNN